MIKIVLASKSKVRKDILTQNNIDFEVIPSNVDEDPVKESLIKEGATPEIISKNLAELKANKVSQKKTDVFVLGAGARSAPPPDTFPGSGARSATELTSTAQEHEHSRNTRHRAEGS